jgi:hypothetical protein
MGGAPSIGNGPRANTEGGTVVFMQLLLHLSCRTPDNAPADIRFAANEAIIFLPMTGVPDLHEE